MSRLRTISAVCTITLMLIGSLAVAATARADDAAPACDAQPTDGLVFHAPYVSDDAEAQLRSVYENVREQPSDTQYHYLLYVPQSAAGRGRVPLVMTMHGLFGSAKQHVGQTQWQATADRHGFALMAPNGHRSWDYTNGSIDTAWLRDAVADAVAGNCVDTTRIFSTGHSMGGFMTHRVACDLGDVFAAGASYAAGDLRNGGPCTPGVDNDGQPIDGWERMSLGNWHGTDDGVVGYGAGRRGMSKWLDESDCDTTPAVRPEFATPPDGSRVEYGSRETWTKCTDGIELVFRTMPGHGHAWPDGCGGQNSGTGGNVACEPEPGTGPWPVATDLTEELWSFLSRFTRASPARLADVGSAPRLDRVPQAPSNVAADGIESGVDSFGAFRRSAPLKGTGSGFTTELTLRFEYTGDGAGMGGEGFAPCPTSNPGPGTQAFDGREIEVSATDRDGVEVIGTARGRAVVTPAGDHEEVYDVALGGKFMPHRTVLRARSAGDVTKFWWSCGSPPVFYKETVDKPTKAERTAP